VRGLSLFLHTVVARGYPRVIGVTRYRSELLLEIALPLLGTVAMVFVYEALHAPRQFLGFAVLGGAMTAFWQNVLWMMATQFFWDRDEGNLELYALAPTSLAAILLGMALGAIGPVVARAAALVAVCSALFHITYAGSGLVPAAGIFLLTLAAIYCLGMMLASLFLFYSREAWHLSNAMQEPVYLLTGFYFPVRALGAYVAGAASILPLTLGLDAMRQLLLPGGLRLIAPEWEALALAVQFVLYAALSQWALRFMETRARRDGRLIARSA
jgi:ABC-2 type transport system permease protein